MGINVPRSTAMLGCALAALTIQLSSTVVAHGQQPVMVDLRVTTAPGATVASVPGMVSFSRGGEIVSQRELIVATGANGFRSQLPPGTYDVRLETEGLVTEVKRGVRFIEGQGIQLEYIVRPGKGVRIVEYADGGLAREEVAARLSSLETRMTKLARDPNAIAVSAGDQASSAKGTVKWFDLPQLGITSIDSKSGLVTAVDPVTKRAVQFQAPTTVVNQLTAGQKVWASFDTKQVSLDAAVPCCPIVGATARP